MLRSTDQFNHRTHPDILSLGGAIIILDSQWEVSALNSRAEQFLGAPAHNLIGIGFDELFSCSTLMGSICSLFQPVISGASITNYPVLLPDSGDGKTKPVLVTLIPLPGPDDSIKGAVICIREATDRMLAHQLALDNVADGVFTVDASWEISSFNSAAENITGWERDEVIGKSCTDVFQSNICGKKCLLYESIRKKAPVIDRSIFMKDRNGNSIPVSISAAPLYDHEGNVLGAVETFRDNSITLKNDLVMESITEGVFTVNRDWKVTSFNRAAEEITGWSRDDALGRSCSEIFHSSICGENCAIAESLYFGKPATNDSITIINSRGEKVPISISAAPLVDHEGNIIGGVETFRDLTAITKLRQELSQQYTFDEIISKSPAMQKLFKLLPAVANSNSTALILGESGTGKELVARAVYNASRRKDQPFVTVNCGALPENLLESELFGYKAGAFTDAKKDKEGRFAAAEKGTLFLDEIGEMPQSVQVKLLRFLQEKVYEPLGSNTPVKADVRIIAATNRDLKEQVQAGTFREDLYYRLNVVELQLPPLRKRKEDIPLLINHFIQRYNAEQGKNIVGISNAALNILMPYNFPGNIRELENIIEYAFILCEEGFILPEHLPEPFSSGEISSDKSLEEGKDEHPSLEEIEKQAIFLALERNNWKKMATCRELGISKDTLRRKTQKFGLKKNSASIKEKQEIF
ncbi:MAG: sigma 54-interacting transcriptional regulator [Desulfurivibrionaceae bacterium]